MKIIIVDFDSVARAISITILVLLVGMLVRNKFNLSLDDSDKDGSNRSGLKVRTDHKTGVQYLETSSGGLTPRLDYDGKIVVAQK